MAKSKKTLWFCKDCEHKEVNYKQMDGLRCPKCGSGFWIGKLVK